MRKPLSSRNPRIRLDQNAMIELLEGNDGGLLMSSLIDTMKCEIYVNHSEQEVFPKNPNCKKSQRGGWQVSSKFAGSSNAMVHSLDEGKRLFIEGSAIKFLTGQNLWGGEDVLELGILFILAVLQQSGITPSRGEIAAIHAGHFRLLRIDLAIHCACHSPEIGSWLLKAIFARANLDAKNLSRVAGYETVYLSQNSKWSSFKIYRKDLELQRFPPAANAFRSAEIRALHIGIARCELVLRRKYLADHGLDNPTVWSSSVFRNLLANQLVGIVPTGGVASARGQFKGLSPQNQLRVRLWAMGDQGELSSPSMINRDRAAIKKATGLDIAFPASADEQRRIQRPLRNELLDGLAFRCHWNDWADHGIELQSFIAQHYQFHRESSPLDDWVEA